MQMVLKIDEARVMKLVMDGMSTKQIEEQLAKELRAEVVMAVKAKLASKLEGYFDRRIDDEYRKALTKSLQDDRAKFITPEKLKKEFTKGEWSTLFEDVVEPILVDFIAHGLQEWLTLEIGVGGKGRDGKKVGSVTVVGTDSWQYRKK